MPDAVLVLEYWNPREGARLAMHQSFGARAVRLFLSPRSLHSGAPFVILVRDASYLGGSCYGFWCSAEACVAVLYALSFCTLARGLADGSRLRSGLVNFGGSSHCAACYFWGLVWVRSGIFFGRKPGLPLGRGSGLMSMGVKMVSGSASLLSIPPFLHPAI